MRLTQGATSTTAVVALVMSTLCAVLLGYYVWLEPDRVRRDTENYRAQTEMIRAQQELADSNNRVAAATIQLTEWLDAQERRFQNAGSRVSP